MNNAKIDELSGAYHLGGDEGRHLMLPSKISVILLRDS